MAFPPPNGFPPKRGEPECWNVECVPPLEMGAPEDWNVEPEKGAPRGWDTPPDGTFGWPYMPAFLACLNSAMRLTAAEGSSLCCIACFGQGYDRLVLSSGQVLNTR